MDRLKNNCARSQTRLSSLWVRLAYSSLSAVTSECMKLIAMLKRIVAEFLTFSSKFGRVRMHT